jgi:hypothetical protein
LPVPSLNAQKYVISYLKFIPVQVTYKLKTMNSLCETLGSQGTEYGTCSVLKITNGQPVLLLSVFLFS